MDALIANSEFLGKVCTTAWAREKSDKTLARWAGLSLSAASSASLPFAFRRNHDCNVRSKRRERQSAVTPLNQSCGGKTIKGGIGLNEIKLNAQGNTGLRIGPGADRFEARRLRLAQVYRIV
ncbi:hypothetical protein VSX64_16245 [Aurantimonas sp. C2-6-R+9]|uniref:hypothetical protein n=1 Tax=unclassified Aurantimonas TaxID=2638230 RepID=UPI002E1816A4|nr:MULTISPECIES: hypothetical protein [unclassified Aurantimonas]MEC5291827.1 hypothetical protein [Aurantimonas sp. C2-3-R2]MEC5382410.1 hypothetical protein [Aurantimonas sp. C2-6-R+9]MEC5412886.1 hypothetical protein [Aurantimonas sp. C2-4-R8]